MVGLWLLSLPAMALQPHPSVFIGQEPVRTRRYHIEQQAHHRHADRWQNFAQGEGVDWKARFDERTGGAHRAWGPGIDLGQLGDLDQVETALRTFFANQPGLLGIELDQLVMGRSGYVESTDTWLVQFDQVLPGTTANLWRSGLMARIKNGKLIMFGVETHPDAVSVSGVPTVSGVDAETAAMLQGPAGNGKHTEISSKLMVLPIEESGSLKYPLVWEVRSKTESPKGHWVGFVDAHSGSLIHVYNEVRFSSGSMYGVHDERTVNGDMATSPLQWMRIQTDGETTFTDDEGGWSLDSDGDVEGDLVGDFLRVHNEEGSDANWYDLEGEVIITDDDATQAEIDTYVFQSQVREWALRYVPDLSIIYSRLDAYVNENENCNAYFDGDIHFMRAGSGCNNSGRIADVNYHEWGHAFHYYNLVSGDFDGSISEGIGDIVSALNTGDSVISPNFYTSGGGIREISTNRVYPDDWVGQVHTDGLIFGGAVWDLWNRLEEDMSEDEAYDVVNTLLVAATRAGPDIPDSFDEFIVADDDNGDLSDGTPHACAIIEAFSVHGLGPGGNGSLMSLVHEPVGSQSADTAVEIDMEAVNMAPGCVDADIDGAKVYYSTDGGDSWDSVGMDGDSSDLSALIPGQPAGTTVSYFLELDTGATGTAMSPSGGDIHPFTFYVGALVELYCESFEESDGGYTHELISGSADEGADDWMWGTPTGMAGDPDFAFSGDRVWGNDLGGGEYNGEYQNNKHNRLTSTDIDVGEYTELVVQYRRWLGVEDGYYDQANVLANEEVVWANHESSRSVGDEHTQDKQWVNHVVPFSADGSGTLQLGWEIISDQGLSMGGWNIDDVCVYAVTAEAPPQTEPDEGVDADDETTVAGTDGEIVSEGKLSGCACSAGAQSGPIGWLGLMLTGLVAAIRRRER